MFARLDLTKDKNQMLHKKYLLLSFSTKIFTIGDHMGHIMAHLIWRVSETFPHVISGTRKALKLNMCAHFQACTTQEKSRLNSGPDVMNHYL